MEQTLYIDILFLIDFSIDFMCLAFSGRICCRKLSVTKSATAAISGALFSVATVIFPMPRGIVFLCSLVFSGLMCRIAYGKNIKICLIVYYLVNLAVSGGITALLGLLGRLESRFDEIIYIENQTAEFILPPYILLILAAISGVAATVGGIFAGGAATSENAEIKLQINGKSFKALGLIDNGNSLREPQSELPCIIIKLDLLENLLNDGIYKFVKSGFVEQVPDNIRIFMIPTCTVGNNTLLCALKPDKIEINGVEKSALLALDAETGDYSGFDALIPPILI